MKTQKIPSSARVQVEPSGAVTVRITPAEFWDLVEFLSYHRLNVSFTFLGPDYLARFGASSADTVKALLADWKNAALRNSLLASAAH